MSSQINLLNDIDYSSTKVIRFPEKIWLFGGPIEEGIDKEPLSIRDKFIRYIYKTKPSFSANISWPEEYPEWSNIAGVGYRDLLEFESDIGCLASLIVIFLESEGALVEFGAFVTDLDLCKKLFIVVSSAHRTENSFIELGPLIRVSRYRPDDAICVIKSKHFSTLQEYELASIVSGIETRLTSKPKLVKWNKNKKAHRLLLAADLADLYQAIDIKTLIALAEKFGFEVKRNELITQARLLKMLGLIKFKEHGIDRFLCTIGSTGHALLDYNGKVGIRIDRARLKIDARAIIDNDEVLRKSLDLR